MENKSRRGLLTKGAVAAAAATALGASGAKAAPRKMEKMEKRSPYPPRDPSKPKPMFSRAVAFGDLLFISGVGHHVPGTIEEHTKGVIDELEQALKDAGSSLQKCLKVGVFLNSLADYDKMNAVYRTYDWGDVPPVRTTVAPGGGIPGSSLVEIDVIAYI